MAKKNWEEQLKRKERWINFQGRLLAAEREKVAGHEELAKVHSAYITILLNKLGATEENKVTITDEEIKEALVRYEARAVKAEGGWSLYCEAIE